MISDGNNKTTTITIKEFLEFDMYAKVILNVVLPKLDSKQYKFKSYKVMIFFVINNNSILMYEFRAIFLTDRQMYIYI